MKLKKEDFIALGLSEELAIKAAEASEDELKLYIEKSKYDTLEATYENKLKQMQIDSAVEKSLMMAKAKNVKAVKALLDLEKAEIENDTVKGLDDQIKKLTEAEDTKFLFETMSTSKPKFKGVTPPDSSGGGTDTPKTLGEAVASHYTSKE